MEGLPRAVGCSAAQEGLEFRCPDSSPVLSLFLGHRRPLSPPTHLSHSEQPVLCPVDIGPLLCLSCPLGWHLCFVYRAESLFLHPQLVGKHLAVA